MLWKYCTNTNAISFSHALATQREWFIRPTPGPISAFPTFSAKVKLSAIPRAVNSLMKECNQCGKCCIHYSDGGLSASTEEIEQWELFNPAIAAYVVDGKIWMDPVSGKQLTHCPWLEVLPNSSDSDPVKYGCLIYNDRPNDCRHYPVLIADMVRDGCEMIELRDLDAPELAQKTLDELMADSRPPLSQAH
ncbi:MAG: Fe-S-cluster containining protein [Halieaceae bacterium]